LDETACLPTSERAFGTDDPQAAYQKDLRNALEAAGSMSISLPLSTLVQQMLDWIRAEKGTSSIGQS
jgi:hypothetical protein